MKKIKVRGLSGTALDWAVARCEGYETYMVKGQLETLFTDKGWKPSVYWAQGGPIIERESMQLTPNENMESWSAGFMFRQGMEDYEGSTPLIAAMRCYVASKLGSEIEIPDEL